MNRARRAPALAVGCLLVGILAGCGSSQQIAEGIRSTVSPISPTTPTAPPSVSTPSTPIPSDPPTSSSGGDLRRVKGAVYSLVMPPGWRNTTSMARQQANGVNIDMALSRTPPSGGYVGFAVINSGQQLLPSQNGSEVARRSLVQDVTGTTNAAVVNLPDLQIDGELAIGVRTTTTVSGAKVVLTAYLPSHFYVIYPIIVTATVGNEKIANRALRAIFASWTWVQ